MVNLGFGMMRLPQKNNNDEKSINYNQLNTMVDTYIKSGFNYFDTAYGYHKGESEVALKKSVIDRYNRSDIIVADKLPVYMINKQSQLNEIFNTQLKRTNTGYFDYYLLHDMGILSDKENKDIDIFSFTKDLKKRGLIRKLGFSSHADAEYIENVLKKHPEVDFIQLQINYLDWENDTIQSHKCYDVACKYNKPIIVMEPLKGGFLVNVPKKAEKLMHDYNGQTPIMWAFRFLSGLDNIIMILSGMNNNKQVIDNMQIFNDLQPLNDEELNILDEVVDIINENIAINCTSCRYCISVCPVGIDIAKLFDMYNHDMIEDAPGYTVCGNIYVNYSKDEKNHIASDCIKCNRCIDRCPQHLNIPKLMDDVKNRFETEVYGFKK